MHNFHAEISGTFPEYSYPTELRLDLKEGAQVMFVKNDPSSEKRYYNGKIGGGSSKTPKSEKPKKEDTNITYEDIIMVIASLEAE